MEIQSNNTAKNASIVAGVGAIISGAGEVIKQKKIFAHPDEFIRNTEAFIAKEKNFANSFYMGTKEAADAARKKLDDYLEQAKKFAKSGKYDYKTIARKAAKGGLMGLAVVLGFELIRKLIIKGAVENKKIEKEIATNPEVVNATKEIEQATGAIAVQKV